MSRTTALGSVLRFTAVAVGAIYGAKHLETLQAMEAKGELPHQKEGAGHGHAHSVMEPTVMMPFKSTGLSMLFRK